MSKKLSVLNVSVEDALEMGRREGVKEILTELKNMCAENTPLHFLKSYITARLNSLNTDPLNGRLRHGQNDKN